MITVQNLHTYRGLSYVLQGVGLTAEGASCTTILGRNGMGKTTLVETVMGLLPAREGSIDLDGNELAGKSPYQIARQGVALVPQGRRVFSSLTVEENLTLGARRGGSANPWTLERVYDLFPNLSRRRRNRGSDLSGGEQQMLVIGRAVMTNPRVLVMDEPSEGLAPVIVDLVGTVIDQLRQQGLCVLLVEQNYGLAVDVADKIYILSGGQIVWDGTSRELEQSPDVRHEHLGV
ncbi:ABC transporter ATP-binding protein [Planosporangium flavigriseum]|uniref:ABC transporter ATP-binding protein n=1 Tax=Planosporangium flavigriseum TaxID=373681 RepID=A0A8J3PLH6_9ACTN|nr:ABC transporter ATP-binding protein [Planosporangium flavigriseum]NJC63113.1 ABC transporter ATP-binding protein [Planosporangium flavigriseum]GIG74491.1 ABC transporter ATP-binding protein [Planosporangium flavigriseum]